MFLNLKSKKTLIVLLSFLLIFAGLFSSTSFAGTPIASLPAIPAACDANTGNSLDIYNHNDDPLCTGKTQYRVIYKSIDCINNTADFEVQAKSDPAFPTPIMGDFNIRINYDSTVMTRIGTGSGSLVIQNNFSNSTPASDPNYSSQNLNGSVQNATTGILSINGFYTGSALGGDIIPNNAFKTISTIRMNIVNPTANLNLDLNDITSFPSTGNNVVILFDQPNGLFEIPTGTQNGANIDLVGSTRTLLCATTASSSSSSASSTTSTQSASSSTTTSSQSLVASSTNSGIAPPTVTGPAASSFTYDPFPIFTGTGQPGATVTIRHNDGTTICTALVQYNGSWTCTVTDPQSEGNQTFFASQSLSGNTSVNTPPITITFYIDSDSATTAEESTAPNNGDANADGLLDGNQNNVASKRKDVNNNLYNTLDAGTGNCKDIKNYDFTPEDPLPTQDIPYDYPLGLFEFTIRCATPGQSVNVTFILDQVYDTTNWIYRKYNSVTQQYNNLPGVTYGTRLIGTVNKTTINFQAQDGGPLDEDGLANGIFRDPSGPAIGNGQQPPSTGGGSITIGNNNSSSSKSSNSTQSIIPQPKSESSIISSLNSSSNLKIEDTLKDSNINLPRTGGEKPNSIFGLFLMILGVALLLSTIEKQENN